MVNIDELQREYAVAVYKRHLHFQLSDVTNDWDDYLETVKEYANRLETIALAYRKQGGYAYDRTISGYHSGDENHYEIDEEVAAEFGIRVKGNSESGTLFIDVDSRYEEPVTKWLMETYPKLSFSVIDAVEIEIPKIYNVQSAEEFLRGLQK